MNQFEEELIQSLGRKKLAKIQSLTIGIGGVGGLGSNCAVNLVRSGFKSFVIIDFDKIEFSNLNRQFYFKDQIGVKKTKALKENLLKINPDLEIEIKDTKVTTDNIKELFKECDIIIEAFDQVASKKLIVEEFINSNKLLVSATGLAGWGNSDQIRIKKIKNKFYLVGDFKTEVSAKLPPISPKVNIVAAKQADIVLNHVLEGQE
ncbi:thiamine biosynthesis protein ThiF, family 2 [Halobacteroides halobius DSM 5150]|uniref:Thiamine biosynthesis protein ThiF, family 2 n=1 Tax=Halobacteroides halobius (strain ATCC 35273 / DSM 5150 / MD-1) TaxID=748449 RepID=L0KA56_HALHC|nr:sulfur carrier protein ThiS adenylyltransferase ThiF [Halobacteroides halobius]AGB41254.1 thiamine biosynthesis protein ThiF, family 2 [Halobacteroides halobius DSM 5150]